MMGEHGLRAAVFERRGRRSTQKPQRNTVGLPNSLLRPLRNFCVLRVEKRKSGTTLESKSGTTPEAQA
jgi:hypothetical protein